MASTIRVEVVYALPDAADRVTLELPRGATVREALERSGILQRRPELSFGERAVGIYGKRVSLDAAPGDGDRIELYRPLRHDPKTARRLRAARSGKR